jgi:2-isopropylmalate synthase
LEGTLLGNGERTGNMDLITVAMNLYSQGVDPRLDLSDPERIIQVVETCTGIPCHPRHPWVGELVYTAYSGSHQDAIRKSLKRQNAAGDELPWRVAYLPIDPRDLGRSYEAVVRVNSQSGKGGIAFVLERDYGLSLPRWLQQALAPVVQRESERRGGVIDAERIYNLFLEHFVRDSGAARLTSYRLARNGHDSIQATVSIHGEERVIEGEGDGAIAAFADACRRGLGVEVNIADYQEHAIGAGTDAEAAAYVLLEVEGAQVPGAAIEQDTVGASLRAVLSAINGAEPMVPHIDGARQSRTPLDAASA